MYRRRLRWLAMRLPVSACPDTRERAARTGKYGRNPGSPVLMRAIEEWARGMNGVCAAR